MTAAEADAWAAGPQLRHGPSGHDAARMARAAARLIAPVRSVLGSDAIAVEHIGSTAVVGLLAKPIIDIAVLLAPEVNATW